MHGSNTHLFNFSLSDSSVSDAMAQTLAEGLKHSDNMEILKYVDFYM